MMMDSEFETTGMAEERATPMVLCQSIIFFCFKGMIEGVVVILFIWLLIQVLLNKHQEVHLQVLLGAGLALLCFCLLMGCAICWHKSRRQRSSISNEKSNGDFELSQRSLSMIDHNQYHTMDEDVTATEEDVQPSKQKSNAKLNRYRVSLPSLYHLPKKTKRVLKRRSTVGGSSSLEGDCDSLVKMSHSHTVPDELSGGKQKVPALGNFTLYYSLGDETLTVTVTGFSNLPKKYRKKDLFVRAYLLPGFMEPHYEHTEEDPDRGQQFAFFNFSPEDLKQLTLRLAVYSRNRSTQKEGFIGETLFLCADMDWNSQTATEFTRELTVNKTKLKKSLSSMDVYTPPTTKSPGQILILLQHQLSASRIKVMVKKGENLGKRTRIPGAPDHFVSIRLIQDNEVMDMKETRTASGSSPVWNAPFLFDVPIESVESQSLCLEFLVMQGRIYNRGRVVGRVLIGAGASETGTAHWQRMYNKSPVECSQWHVLQPDDL